jgi:xanthine dehydrogenase YagS FAD-binding subunit
MRQFDYSSATTLDGTIQLLGQNAVGQAESIKALAGGTDLLPMMKADIATPSQLIDIKRLDEIPQGIGEDSSGVTLGALTKLADIELSELIRSRFPVLAQAASLAATPQLRNMATIGGNLLQRPRCWYFRQAQFHCWLKGGDDCYARDGQNQLHALYGDSPCVAVHPSDLAAALLALDAEVQLRGPAGERSLALGEFFTLPQDNHRRETQIAADELLISIRIPAKPAATRSIYLKAMDRKVWAFALVGVAVQLAMMGNSVADARIVLSGVAPIPWRLSAAEQMVQGQTLDEALIARVAAMALTGAQPLAHNGYKVPLAQSLIRRALSDLVQTA